MLKRNLFLINSNNSLFITNFNLIKRYSSKIDDVNKYSKTVLLPKTSFPLRISNSKRLENDQFIQKTSFFNDLYQWQRQHLKGPEFVLHDGPPYANGKPHMGHAINKILKDIILRHKIISGTRVHYVPGWDCHGLPIELKAAQVEKNTVQNTLDVRDKAYKFATDTIQLQKDIFKSWGVMADWENGFYTTYNENYIKKQLKLFYELYERGLVYRALKPVYWSPSSKTALAESELIYNPDHKSTAVIVKFKLSSLPPGLDTLKAWNSVYVLVWTTTPWTLPANQAICYNPELEYGVFETSSASPEYYIYSKSSMINAGISLDKEMWELSQFSGSKFQNAQYTHPLTGQLLPMLPADHVVASKGTGLVHTAPAHGHDDFLVGIKHKLNTDPIVDEYGNFNKSAGVFLNGLSIFDEGKKRLLKGIEDHIVTQSEYIHSYPYDWRTNQPVIIRASEQWFINTDKLKDKAIECLKSVKIFPPRSAEYFQSAMLDKLRSRPYWCISRQRVWGVPIPVFYNKHTKQPHITEEFIENACKLIDLYGTNFWWTRQLNEFFPYGYTDDNGLRLDDIELGQDIFDIWFDSGITWNNVLEKNKVADLYLEGVDQITGWFQSSLLTSVALNKCAPFRNLYVHGFVLDEKGRKMSKSLGNVVDPEEIAYGKDGKNGYGIDVLRWWVAQHGLSDSKVSLRKTVLETSAQNVQKIRSVFRFLISNLNDYNTNQLVPKNSLQIIDQYLLHLLVGLCEEVDRQFAAYQINKVCSLLSKFIINYVSALYCTTVKNRLYCEKQDSLSRRAAQQVIYQTLMTLNACLAPILPYLCEEINIHLPEQLKMESVFKERRVIDPMWRQPKVEAAVSCVIGIKNELNKLALNQTLPALTVTLRAPYSDMHKLYQFQKDSVSIDSELVDLLQVSEVILEVIDDNSVNTIKESFEINFKPTKYYQCPRCRRYNSLNSDDCCNYCLKQLVGNDLRIELEE